MMTAEDMFAANAALATIVYSRDKKYSAEAMAVLVQTIPPTRSMLSYWWRRIGHNLMRHSTRPARMVAAGIGMIDQTSNSQRDEILKPDDPVMIGHWMVAHKYRHFIAQGGKLKGTPSVRGRISIKSRHWVTREDYDSYSIDYLFAKNGTFLPALLIGSSGDSGMIVKTPDRGMLMLDMAEPSPKI